jgi:hypothetical protein
MAKSDIYITEDTEKLDRLTIEELVKHKIWRTLKSGGYKYQTFRSMADEHLHRTIDIFMKTDNYIVLAALREELEYRKTRAENEKQKIKQMKITMSQSEFSFVEKQNTYNEAVKASENIQEEATVENFLKAEFTKGQVIGEYTVVDIASTNHRGYTLTVQKNGEESTFVMPQSKFKKKLGFYKSGKKKKKTTVKASPKQQNVKQAPTNTTVCAQKYKIGDIVGSREVLNVRKNNRGRTKGYGYYVKDANNKKYWIKQSELLGKVSYKATPSTTPTVDDYAVKETHLDIKREIKKMGFFDKVKMLFS